MRLNELKTELRTMSAMYRDREQRSRRIFIQEQAQSLRNNRHKEFVIKSEIADYFKISYTSISFCGSAQLGFSVHKDRLFEPTVSDLDVACIDVDLFQIAWTDVIRNTNGFSDLTPFGGKNLEAIELFKNQILKRGMININAMPNSPKKVLWTQFQNKITQKHKDLFGKITVAIYMNEHGFCWKQDSALTALAGE